MHIKNIFHSRDCFFDKHYSLKFLNSLYYKRHKNKSHSLYLQLLSFLKETHKRSNTKVLLLGIYLGKLEVLTISVKIAGKVHNIPVPVNVSKQYSKFLKTLAQNFKVKRSNGANEKIQEEFKSILSQSRGFVQIKQEAMFDQAIDELSFAHFRWR